MPNKLNIYLEAKYFSVDSKVTGVIKLFKRHDQHMMKCVFGPWKLSIWTEQKYQFAASLGTAGFRDAVCLRVGQRG